MVMARKSIGEWAGNVRLAVEFVVASPMTARRVQTSTSGSKNKRIKDYSLLRWGEAEEGDKAED